MSPPACPLCRHDEATRIHRSGDWGVWVCAACSHGWTWPVPTRDELKAVYGHETYYEERGMRAPSEAHDARAAAITERVRGSRFLDVGCGLGGLVEAMERRGWSAVGIETSAIGAERAQALGRDVRRGSWADVDLRGESPFDLISFIHVLEHLPDPLAALRWAGAALVSGGRLLIEVPNRDTWETRRSAAARDRIYDLPAHLHHFTEGSLTDLVGRAGFVDVRVAVSVPDAALRLVDMLARLRRGGGGASDGRRSAAPSAPAPTDRVGPARAGGARRGWGAHMLRALRRVVPGYKLTAWARWP